jgi:glutathione synthase/RimK-type ligase-like ATP-grasp enzyme
VPSVIPEVLIVSDPEDLHATALAEHLLSQGHKAIRFNLRDLRSQEIESSIGSAKLRIDHSEYLVTEKTVIWWRRPGHVEASDLEPEEAQLAQDEGPHILIGSLGAAGVKFVDHPAATSWAEYKPVQLSVAQSLGISIPPTTITNDVATAMAFAGGKEIVAKALSPGFGIAPFVATIRRPDLEKVRALPVMLQELIPSGADCRVVVVGGSAWAWRRPREAGTVDWRQADPAGSEFVLLDSEPLAAQAVRLTAALGLSVSIQDWLETEIGHCFLESNAQGAWLFLKSSNELIVPELAAHLLRQVRCG